MSFSFKNFEDVRLKATYGFKFGDKEFVEGETIALFDQIQIAGLETVVESVNAHGGFDDRGLVYWESIREERLRFSQGVFNRVEFGLMLSAGVISSAAENSIPITWREYLESDENCQVTLKFIPEGRIFVYDLMGNKIHYTQDEKVVTIDNPYTNIVVDYIYNYNNGADIYKVGSKFISGFVSLEGLTRVKDDETGNVVTGVLKIPHLKLTSNLSIRLGAQATPVVGNFEAVGVPVGERGQSYISEFYLLNDDLKADF